MCPACLATAATTVVSVAAGASSVGGVAAIVIARLAGKPSEGADGKSTYSEGDDNGAAENRIPR
jgi:hypothetical protein